ncbi:hypothetical protein EUGRSUZ_D01176 [Eucalyptus grandis]|uniref:Uncharacterized protein n=2 Tax=Eucalyptus grandis TaxID=71139 RepID=A0A059CF77_EUCGR|nr:hypothetical protein EUGRSUZ_D01176 [Eucalyptus grandis]KAK3433894.1 hypothetical protein EUGRSUZ_D01176 [Eucalyptus grandis]
MLLETPSERLSFATRPHARALGPASVRLKFPFQGRASTEDVFWFWPGPGKSLSSPGAPLKFFHMFKSPVL